MKKYDDLQNDKDLWSYAVQSEIAEIRDRAIQQEMYDSGKADGKNEGLIEGKITTLQALIQAKYHEDAREWLLTLTPEQLEEATIHILSCDSLEILKTRLSKK
ncbi:transposase [[Eubacterium] hominis]|uniref:transposase n=1 Tax=[Eubacterium] hominis TaxID=2764325 RepID=UPI003A4DEF9A